jgi:hypothetical protein
MQMDLDVLRVFTATFVSESKMTKGSKRDLLEYVMSAGKDELLYYLATGSISTGIIKESDTLSYTENYIEGLIFEAKKPKPKKKGEGYFRQAFEKGKEFKSWAGKNVTAGAKSVSTAYHKHKGTIGVTLAVAAATAAAYATYKRYFTAAAKACRNSEDREECLRQYRKKAALQKAQDLQSSLSKCNNTNDPEKCKASIANKIAKAKAEAASIGT